MQRKYHHDEWTIKETFSRNFQMPAGASAPSVGVRNTSPTALLTDRHNETDTDNRSYGRLYYHIHICKANQQFPK
jgi:hypothetical protein